ncbi:MAG: glycosyltransferase family 2 protein [Labilithrix sp.]|nr:glycosyltransferase family 2 protein [Labilithrix sp.]
MPRPELSLVVPVHDAEDVLPKLDERVREMLDRHGLDCEVVFVDDGSRDRSLEMLRGYVAREGRYRAIALTRRFGADRAVTCGVDAARGKAVIVMDELGDPPDVLLDLVAKWREGFDVVYARRRRVVPAPLLERAIKRLFRATSSLDVAFDDGSFFLMSRRAVRATRRLRETHRWVRGVVAWVGLRQETIDYDARAPKRSLRETLGAAFDALASSSVVPLRLGIHLGLFFGLCSVLFVLAALVTSIAGGVVPSWASTFALVMFMSSVQLLVVGLLGEYVGRAYEQAKGRPIYIVAERLGYAARRRLTTEDFGSVGEVARKTDRPAAGAPPPPAAPAAPAPSVPPPLPARASARPPIPSPPRVPTIEPSSSSSSSSSKPPPVDPASSKPKPVATKPPPPLPSASKK